MTPKTIQQVVEALPETGESFLKYANQRLPWFLRYGTTVITFLLGVTLLCLFLFFKL
jgi:hypothetical protein